MIFKCYYVDSYDTMMIDFDIDKIVPIVDPVQLIISHLINALKIVTFCY